MTTLLITGIIGSLFLVLGAAWPESKDVKHPRKSVKNWLFMVGCLIMLLYSTLGYLEGSPIFFLFLQILILIADILMMLNTDDRIDASVITLGTISLAVWSLYLSQNYETLLFIAGLGLLGAGYAFGMGTLRRNVGLTIGSIFIAIFSYLTASWIFFWLNIFFALFSGYYLIKSLRK